MRRFISFSVLVNIFILCTTQKESDKALEVEELLPSELPGEALAIRHCGSCHAFVSPQMLPKASWEESVLPSMGHRLGFYKGEHQPDSLFDKDRGGRIVRRANIYPEKPTMARADWQKIIDYYVENAPDSIPPPARSKNITMRLKHFKYQETTYSHRPALTIMVKILPENRGIVYADAKPFNKSIYNLTFLKSDLQLDHEAYFDSAPIHYYERSDTVYLATIGKTMFPHDAPNGTINKIYQNGSQPKNKAANKIITNLQRPVALQYADLNNDGLEDIVVCEFGNLTGKLVWFENMGADNYSMRPLRGQPGAISLVVKDVNADGFQDIIVLMAQGDEGVFLYRNRGNGTFTEERLLSFLPLYGSQYIELADFDKDGFDDLIYVCGDNADQTPILKSYHGIYIYLNDGNYKFRKKYFYQLNGAYKAIPRDFDLDGDLDIAAISFFPDYYSYPEESFIYLENKGNFDFVDYSFPESTNGRWIVMDANDMDGDGDIDLALGSFVYFIADGDTTGLGNRWMVNGPSIAILENTLR